MNQIAIVRAMKILTIEDWFILFVLISVSLLVGVDLISDLASGVRSGHFVLEMVVVLLAGTGFVFLVKKATLAEKGFRRSKEQLDNLEKDLKRWKESSEKLIQGLSQAIDHQFAMWGLSTSEREVANLLLKGLSLKEIAEVRSCAEKTVRVQATAVYQKSGLSGRAELSAFFLEDLLK